MTTQTTRHPVEEPAARIAAVHILRGESPRTRDVEADGNTSVLDGTPLADRSLVEAIKARGWAVPVARRVEDIDAETLAEVARLSEDGVAHLFASEAGDGLVLAMAGSTAADRRRAVERLPVSSGRPPADRRVFGVLVEAGEAGSHYSEQEGWGLTGNSGKASPDREVEVAADLFRASRAGSLAVAGTKAERRRIEANRERLRAEFVSRRRRGEELVARPAREIDAERKEQRRTHWTEDAQLRRRVERARRSGRAAYDTARAVYLRQLPTLAHRLLHLLRRKGAVREREFVSCHARLAASGAAEPEAIVVAALRELAEAGKVRRLRSRKTGEVFVSATDALDVGDYRSSLNGLVRDGRFGIANPWVEAGTVEAGGEEDEWERGTEDLEAFEAARLAPRRLRSAPAYEQPLPAADLVAEPSAQEEIEAVAEEVV